jgi:cell division protein FtsL
VKRQLLGVAILVPAVLTSAVGVVYARHLTRGLFAQLQGLRAERDDLDVEWSKLQLEQSTWATHARVETVARTRLQMILPRQEDIVVVTP